MFAPGELVAGRYRLIRLIGQGGMGTVWAATNVAIQRDVAIKVMRRDLADEPMALQRFFNEARACGSIRHPGIVDVLDLGTADDGSSFLVLELLEGEALDRTLERLGTVPAAAILPVVRDVARTIALAHERSVIHRDLKPANVFLHRPHPGGGVIVKVLDFGISKVMTPGGSQKTTRTGTVVGSPAYMSPEHALGKVEVDERTDVYALGVILYEALSGRMPFQDDNYNSLIVAIATSSPPDIATLVPGLPGPLVKLVRDAMAFDRAKRIPNMNELAERAEAILPSLQPVEPLLPPAEGTTAPSLRVPDAGARTASVLTSSVVDGRSAPAWLSIGIGAALALALSVVVFAIVRGSPQPVADPTSATLPIDSAPDTRAVASAPPPPSAVVSPAVASPASAIPVDATEATNEPSATASRPGVSAPVPATSAPSQKPRPPKKPPRRGKDAWGYD